MSDTTTFRGIGRRKTAIARVQLNKDSKDKTVNGVPFTDFFQTEALQRVALSPLSITSQTDEFGMAIKVEGGGIVAQSEAVQLGIARALLEMDEGYKKQLRHAGMLTRDPRMKERKKPGLRGARRAPQFSKR